MNESQSILDSLRRIVRALRLNSTQIQKDLGLSSAQFFVLQKLEFNEWVPISELAKRTSTDQSSVSVVVKKLIAEKLLLKKTHPTDRRSAIVSLSLIGQRYARSSKPLVQNQLIQGIETLSADQRQNLSTLLLELVHASELNRQEPLLFFEEGKPRASSKKNIVRKKSE
jgi:DNA-binding MarR family transcriptional regulator